MGYRHYFFKVNKEDVEKVRHLSLEQLKEKYGQIEYDEFYIDINNVISHENIFEFGKLYYDDTVEQICQTGERLFNDNEVVDYFADNDFYVVGKDGVLKAIEIYKNKVIAYYEDLLTDEVKYVTPSGLLRLQIEDEDVRSIDKIKDHLKHKLLNWRSFDRWIMSNYNEYTLTNSWEYEYEIFNLIHILKVIDWENETLLFYGY